MRFKTRDLVTIGILGAIWGALELTLGSYLHVIFPQVSSPLVGTGTILTALGIIVALIGRRFVPRTGSVLMIGVVAALLKLLSVGGVKLSPMLAIVIECALAEIALLLIKRPKPVAYIVAGVLALLWTLLHKFFGSFVFLGKGFGQVYTGLVNQGAEALGVGAGWAVAVIIVFVLIRVVVGASAGWLGWVLGGAVRQRLAREGSE